MSKGTTRRTIRIEDELWDSAQEEASRNGDNLSEIVRDVLRKYVEGTFADMMAARSLAAVQHESWKAKQG